MFQSLLFHRPSDARDATLARASRSVIEDLEDLEDRRLFATW